jgi:hypothetical protein
MNVVALAAAPASRRHGERSDHHTDCRCGGHRREVSWLALIHHRAPVRGVGIALGQLEGEVPVLGARSVAETEGREYGPPLFGSKGFYPDCCNYSVLGASPAQLKGWGYTGTAHPRIRRDDLRHVWERKPCHVPFLPCLRNGSGRDSGAHPSA